MRQKPLMEVLVCNSLIGECENGRGITFGREGRQIDGECELLAAVEIYWQPNIDKPSTLSRAPFLSVKTPNVTPQPVCSLITAEVNEGVQKKNHRSDLNDFSRTYVRLESTQKSYKCLHWSFCQVSIWSQKDLNVNSNIPHQIDPIFSLVHFRKNIWD